MPYDFLQLNDMPVPQLLKVAGKLNIDGADSLDKQKLIYKILDMQALNGKTDEDATTGKRTRKPKEPAATAPVAASAPAKAPEKAKPALKKEAPKREPAKKPSPVAAPKRNPSVNEAPTPPVDKAEVAVPEVTVVQPEVATAAPKKLEMPEAKAEQPVPQRFHFFRHR